MRPYPLLAREGNRENAYELHFQKAEEGADSTANDERLAYVRPHHQYGRENNPTHLPKKDHYATDRPLASTALRNPTQGGFSLPLAERPLHQSFLDYVRKE